MLYMARTAHLQEDESIQCDGVAEADPEATPWALLALTAAADDPTWRLVGTYASETAALAARRRLSRRLGAAAGAPRVRYEPEALHKIDASPSVGPHIRERAYVRGLSGRVAHVDDQ